MLTSPSSIFWIFPSPELFWTLLYLTASQKPLQEYLFPFVLSSLHLLLPQPALLSDFNSFEGKFILSLMFILYLHATRQDKQQKECVFTCRQGKKTTLLLHNTSRYHDNSILWVNISFTSLEQTLKQPHYKRWLWAEVYPSWGFQNTVLIEMYSMYEQKTLC